LTKPRITLLSDLGGRQVAVRWTSNGLDGDPALIEQIHEVVPEGERHDPVALIGSLEAAGMPVSVVFGEVDDDA
jgi:hypothetical protein